MKPDVLLKATQKAAGDARLTEWHETLIVDKQELLKLHVVRRGKLRETGSALMDG